MEKITANNEESISTSSLLPKAKLSTAALPSLLPKSSVDHGSTLQLAKHVPSKIPTSSPTKAWTVIPSSSSKTKPDPSPMRVPSRLPTAAPKKAWTAPTPSPYSYTQLDTGGRKVPTSFPIAPTSSPTAPIPRPTIGIWYISPIAPQSNARKIPPTRSPSGPSRRPTAFPTNPTARPTAMPTNPTTTPTEEPTYCEPTIKPLKK